MAQATRAYRSQSKAGRRPSAPSSAAPKAMVQGSSALAPKYAPQPRLRPVPGPQGRPDTAAKPRLRALPGQKTEARKKPVLAPMARTVLAMTMISVVFIAAVCIVRIAIINQTSQVAYASELLSSDISSARAAAVTLEMQHALATNTQKIQGRATSIGMLPDLTVETAAAATALSEEAKAMFRAAAEQNAAAQRSEAAAQQSASAAQTSAASTS